jgi:hypothetical protein
MGEKDVHEHDNGTDNHRDYSDLQAVRLSE